MSNSPISVSAVIDDIRTVVSLPPISNNLVHAPSSISGALPCTSGHEPATTNPEPKSELIASDTGNPKSVAKKFNTVNELNWCDRVEVMANQDLFDWGPKTWFLTAENKRLNFPDGFDKGNYFENLIPIISSGYQRAEKIVCCGRKKLNFKVPCDQWALCSKCAYVLGMKATERFAGVFDKSTFFHITLGFYGDIPFGETSCLNARRYWDANSNVIKHLIDRHLIEGAYFSHELKIRSFLPLRVNPHSHVIVAVHDDEIGDDMINAMEEMVRTSPGVKLVPSVCVKKINTKTDLDRGIRYLTKSMDLQEPYRTAWVKHCTADRKRVPELNLEMKGFLDAQAAAFARFNRIVYMGNLTPQRKEFIGTRPNKRKKKKRRKKPRP